MNYITLASGIATDMVAWRNLGWNAQFFSEISKFPSALLKYRYPHVPNLGDMLHVQNSPIYQNATVDLVFAGTPCQSFSIAGLRKGLRDPRGNLALQFLRIADDFKSRWLLWENVPGVLTFWSDAEIDNEGRIWQTNDFETFIAAIQELGYSVAWRVLDAQYYGVPQRRRRVFVVGYRGDWRRAAAVLFEPESLRGNFTPGKTSLANTPGSIEGKTGGNSEDVYVMAGGQGRAELYEGVSPTLNCNRDQPILIFQSKASASQSMSVSQLSPALDASKSNGLAFLDMRNMAMSDVSLTIQVGGNSWSANSLPHVYVDIHPTLPAGSHNQGAGVSAETAEGLINHRGRIRRITPLEAERLQGYPDYYTLFLYGNKMSADGPRYHAIGNGIAVPVLEWIGERINIIDKLP